MQIVHSLQFSPYTAANTQSGDSSNFPIKYHPSQLKKAPQKTAKFSGNCIEKIKKSIAEFFAAIIAYIFALGIKRKTEGAPKNESV